MTGPALAGQAKIPGKRIAAAECSSTLRNTGIIDPDLHPRARFLSAWAGPLGSIARNAPADVCCARLPVEILVGGSPQPPHGRLPDPHPCPPYADYLASRFPLRPEIRVLDIMVALSCAVRDELVVSGELLPMPSSSKIRSIQHFLHLVTDGELVLEDKSDVSPRYTWRCFLCAMTSPDTGRSRA